MKQVYGFFALKRIQFIGLLLVVLLAGCQDDDMPDVTREAGAIEDVYNIMKDWYLWNDELPELDLSQFNTPQEVMEALRKTPIDHWSFIEDAETYNQLFEQGKYEGYGVRFEWENQNILRLAFVYKDSPFYEVGVRRGWKINKINGQSVPNLTTNLSDATNTFEFENPEGKIVNGTFTKKEIAVNTVLYDSIITVNNNKIGYLVFNSFLQTSEAELKAVFTEFKAAGITDLILDMRYNGGGRVTIAEYLATNIIGPAGSGKNFIEYVHNEDRAEFYNKNQTFIDPELPLNLTRLIALTSKSTASASELIINGLKPFMDIILIGENTHGKPVGSYSFNDRDKKYAINPISFAITNADGEGYYFDGLPVDAHIADDLIHDFGDPEEARLKEALYYIEHGEFSDSGARQLPVAHTKKTVAYEGIYQITGAF